MTDGGDGSKSRLVVVSDVAADRRQRIAADIVESGDVAVDAVPSVAQLREAFATADPECVVTGTDLEDGDWRDLLDAVEEADPDLPVVLYPADEDARLAAAATRYGAAGYLPESEDDSGLPAVVRSLADDYRRHRTRRVESSRYRAIMETLPLSLYVKDEDARYVDVSAKLEDDGDADLIGRTDADIWGEPDEDELFESYRDDLEVVETGEPVVGKEEHHVFGGESVWVETSKFPWRDEDGEVRGIVGMTRNVSGQRARLRELRQKSQRLEQFAGFVSHDLRNPVNIAQGYLDRAIETGDEAALEEVEGALDRMEGLIEDLLVTVRNEDADEEWIEFRPFVERVWATSETENTELALEVPDEAMLVAVPGQLRQVLDNLFRNAEQHAGEGVTVTVGLTDAGFYVEDDGEGIDAELRERVIEYGVTDGGTGIGLAIVRDIAESHGWELRVSESEAGGARFEFQNCPVRRREVSELCPSDAVPIEDVIDVGDPTPSSSYERSDDGRTWTVNAGGQDVWQDLEEHFLAYATLEGSVRIVAKVGEIEDVHEYSKAGVMVRDSPVGGSPLAYVGATPKNGTEVGYRPSEGEHIETTQDVDVGGAPRWYRIDWIDSAVSLMTSPDGTDWTTVERRAIGGRDPVVAGIAVCSHDPERTARAVFEEVRAVELRPED